MDTGGEKNPNHPDQENGSGYGYAKAEKPDGFVMIDVESFAPLLHKDLSSNSRITLQRSVSRKGSGRSNNERKIHYDVNGNNDIDASIPHSPLRGSGTPEKSAAVGSPVGPVTTATTSSSAAGPPSHQITIAAGNISDQAERRFGFTKKASFKRSPASWIQDPKRVVLFFATLSSVGSILLIIFTLTMSKTSSEDIIQH